MPEEPCRIPGLCLRSAGFLAAGSRTASRQQLFGHELTNVSGAMRFVKDGRNATD